MHSALSSCCWLHCMERLCGEKFKYSGFWSFISVLCYRPEIHCSTVVRQHLRQWLLGCFSRRAAECPLERGALQEKGQLPAPGPITRCLPSLGSCSNFCDVMCRTALLQNKYSEMGREEGEKGGKNGLPSELLIWNTKHFIDRRKPGRKEAVWYCTKSEKKKKKNHVHLFSTIYCIMTAIFPVCIYSSDYTA